MYPRIHRMNTNWLKCCRLMLALCFIILGWLMLMTSHTHNSDVVMRDEALERDVNDAQAVIGANINSRPRMLDLQKICNSRQGRTVMKTFRELVSVINNTHSGDVRISVVVQETANNSAPSANSHPGGSSRARKSLIKSQRKSSDAENKTVNSSYSAFENLMTFDERDLLLDVALKLAQLTNQMNISYFMYGGSLLGSYRHHDVIPWDDDIDVLVNISSKELLYYTLRELHPRYGVFLAGPRLKFFHANSVHTSKYPWKWPYVDVHFFKENTTHIWDSSPDFHSYIYNKDEVFPLHPRPLGKAFLASPFDAYANIQATYSDTTMCSTPFYSHKYEKNGDIKTHRTPCKHLRDRVPFVHRSPDSRGVRETLMLGSSIIQSLVVDEPPYSIADPYTMELL